MLLESRKMHFERSKRGKEQQGTSHPSAEARGDFFTFLSRNDSLVFVHFALTLEGVQQDGVRLSN
jgi:hypothetical protein